LISSSTAIALSTQIQALSDLSSYQELQQAYIDANFKSFHLIAGRKINTGYNQPSTSSGMLCISNNALPIPKVGFYMSDYENIPFTKGFAQFKASFLHGWLGEKESYIKNAYLHEKSLFIKFGANKPVDISIGLQHFAQWGGTDPAINKKLPQDIKAFWDVVKAKFRPSGTDSTFINEYLNRVGNHVEHGTLDSIINYQVIFFQLFTVCHLKMEAVQGFGRIKIFLPVFTLR